MVVYSDQGAGEGEDFAECDEDGVMDFSQRWAAEARDEQCASKYAETYRYDQLYFLHEDFCLTTIIVNLVVN